MLRKTLPALVLLLALAVCAHASAAIARSNQWTGKGSSTSCATGCIFSTAVTPTAGALEIMSVYQYNSAAAPTGATFTDNNGGTWTVFNSTLGTPRNTFVAWHIAQPGDTSYKFTPTVASGTTYFGAVIAEYAGTNTSAPWNVNPTFASPTAAATIAGPSITTTTTNTMVLVGFGNGNQAETGMTAGWGVINGGASADVFETLADAGQAAAGASTPPSITYAAVPSQPQTWSGALAAAPAIPTGGSTLSIAWSGGQHISLSNPTPTPLPANTPPPPASYMYFGGFGENVTTTPAQVTQYLSNVLCEGVETNSAGASIFNCGGQGQYWSLNMGQPTLSGHDTSVPWAAGETGTGCPEPSGANFWASTVPAYTDPNVATNWFVWPTGTTVGTINATSDIGAATYQGGPPPNVPTTYLLVLPFLNMASTTMQSYAQQVLKHCGDHDRWSFAREDNAVFGNQSLDFAIYGSHSPPAYSQMKNFGGQSQGPPYASTNCNGGGHLAFNGSRCTRPAQLTANETTTQTFPTDAALKAAQCSMYNALNHNNGKPMLFMINNAFSTDMTVLGCAHVFASQAEKYIVGGCGPGVVVSGTGNDLINPCLGGLFGHPTVFSSANVATIVNYCAATVSDTPGKQNMVEDFAAVAQNTALMQWNFRAHWGALWACENDAYPNMMMSFAYFGNGVAGDTGRYSPDFVEPFNRITPFFRRPTSASGGLNCAANAFANDMGTGALCTINGINDPNICRNAAGTGAGSGNNCVLAVEFNHTYWQPTPDLTKWPSTSPVYAGTNTVTDLGQSCLVYNNTASAIQITSTVLANLCPFTAPGLTKIAADCTPLGYFNTSGSGLIYNLPSGGEGSVCAGTTYASVNQGGTFDHSQLISGILNEFLAPNDSALFTQT